MPLRWIYLTATVLDDAGHLHSTDGYVADACPGLAVTRTLEGDTVPPGWSVTHRDSGCRLSHETVAETREAAQAMALALAERARWGVAADALRGSPTLAEAVAAVVGLERAGVR